MLLPLLITTIHVSKLSLVNFLAFDC
uniref:Uncharacterized protein n=1 Tax=Arundo donax TaxID=35708 RepID=A0A0A9E5Y6_ARUDO